MTFELACPACLRRFQSDADLSNCPDDNTELVPYIQDPFIGRVVGEKYEIIEQIGIGGWGLVYKAKHKGLNRTVALKLLHLHLVSSLDKLKRFEEEAMTASRIVHPALCQVTDCGVLENGQPYLIMEFLQGKSLGELIDRVKFITPELATDIFSQVSSGLAALHKAGIVHRDLKTSNIMLIDDGDRKLAKIIDFGLARLVDNEKRLQLTQTGETCGTPAYMSPEQCRGDALDTRSDVYSLGCVMYESITGQKPFTGRTSFEIMARQLNEYPPAFAEVRPELKKSTALEEVVFRCIEKDPKDRYQSMQEIHDHLTSSLQTRARRKIRRKRRPISVRMQIAIGALALAGVVALAVTQLQTVFTAGVNAAGFNYDADAKKVEMAIKQLEGERALSLGSKLRDEAEKKYGKESVQAANAIRMIADAHTLDNDMKTADKEYKTAIAILEKVAPASVPMTRALLAHGFLYFEKRDLQKANEMFDRAGVMARNVGGENSYENVLVLVGAAHLLNAEHKYSASIKTHKHAQAIMEKLGLPGKDPIYAYSWLGLAEVTDETKEFKTSQEYLDRAIKEVEKFGDEWVLVKDVLFDEATTLFVHQRNYAKAGELAKAKLKGILEKGGADDPAVADIYCMIATAEAGLGKTAEADANFKKAVTLVKDLDDQDPLYQDTVGRYASFLRRNNRPREAADLEKTVDRGFERGYERKGFADPK